MSRQRGSRRRRGRERVATQPGDASHAASGRPAAHASRIAVAFALFLGLFLGRVFSDNLSAGTLGLIDLVIFAGLAATIALAFRRWARRTIEDRERQRRRRSAGSRTPGPGDPEDNAPVR